MQAMSRLVAFVLVGFLLSLPVLGDEKKDNKADPPKEDAKKAEAKKEEPAKKNAKQAEPAKKAADPKAPAPKLPPRRGQFKQYEDNPDTAFKKMLLKSPTVSATVVAVEEDKKSLRLRVTIPYVRFNEGQVQNYLNAQMNMARATDPQGLLNAQNSMAQAGAQLYEIHRVDREVEWTATDEVKVRRNAPPPQFDDKGRVKPYTAKDLRELKGEDKLPGYPAGFSDLKSGQFVQVTLQQKKGAPRPIKRGKDAEGEALADDLPKITFIVIVSEGRN